MEMNKLLIDGANSLIHNEPFMLFLGLVAFDYFTGVLKSCIWKVTDSSAGMKGLIKHSVVIIAFMFVWLLSDTYNATYVGYILTILYSINYLISILENFAVMGIYQPAFLKVKLQSELRKYEKQLEDGLTNKDLLEGVKPQKIEVSVDNGAVVDFLRSQGRVDDTTTMGELKEMIQEVKQPIKKKDGADNG